MMNQSSGNKNFLPNFTNIGQLLEIDPTLFEHIVTEAFNRYGGTNLVTTPQSNDGGVDAYGTTSGKNKFVIQTKRTRQKFSVAEFREFLGAMVLSNHRNGLIVSVSGFTSSVESKRKIANGHNFKVILLDGKTLIKLLQERR